MGVMTHSWESRLIHMTHDLFTQTHTYLYLSFKGIEFTCLYMHTQIDTYPRTDTPPLHTRMHAYLAFQGIEFVHLKPQSECERQNVYIHIYTCTSRSRASSSRIGICTQMDTFTQRQRPARYTNTHASLTSILRVQGHRVRASVYAHSWMHSQRQRPTAYTNTNAYLTAYVYFAFKGIELVHSKKKSECERWYLHIYTYILTHVYIYTDTYIHIYLHIYTYILTHIYICIRTLCSGALSVRTLKTLRVRKVVRKHTHMYTYTHS